MSDQSGMSALTERGALDLAIATLQRRVKERDAEIGRQRVALVAVEEWWLTDGIHHFVGAPYAIFAVRAALTKPPV